MRNNDKPTALRENRLLQGLVGWLGFFWVLTAIAPYDRFDWLLENLLVFVYAAAFIKTYARFPLSNLSYGLLALFATLHLIGAHYTYARTPFGFWLQEWFALSRNPYDRLVHFAFGLLWAYPLREVLLRLARGLSPGGSSFLAVNLVLSFSAFFEVLESWIAMAVSPDLGDAYLGTQGDIWDAQWDMFLALAGAGVAMTLTHLAARPLTRLSADSPTPG